MLDYLLKCLDKMQKAIFLKQIQMYTKVIILTLKPQKSMVFVRTYVIQC